MPVDSLLNKKIPGNILERIQALETEVRMLKARNSSAEHLSELAKDFGDLQFRAVDSSGNLRFIMSGVDLLEEFGVSAHLLALAADSITPTWYVDADDGTMRAGAGAVVLDQYGIGYRKAGVFSEFNNITSGVGELYVQQLVHGNGAEQIFFHATAKKTLTNPGFETGDLTGWTTVAGTPAVVSNPVHGGSYALQLNSVNEAVESSSFVTMSGEAALVDVWFYPTANGDIANISIDCYNASSVLVGTSYFGALRAEGGDFNRWHHYYSVRYFPAGTTKVKVSLLRATSGTVYFDDINLWDGNGAQIGFYGSGGLQIDGPITFQTSLGIVKDLSVLGALDAGSIKVGLGSVLDIIDKGSWTPTITQIANLDGVTVNLGYWFQVGDRVHCWGQFNADATTAGTLTRLALSLPITASFTSAAQLAGIAAVATNNQVARIFGDTTNHRAEVNYQAVDGTNRTFSFEFSYVI